MRKYTFFFTILLILTVMLSGCNFPGRNETTPTSQVDQLNTVAAQTIQAQQTALAQTGQPGGQTPSVPTETIQPSETQSQEPGEPSATPEPSLTPTRTPTQTEQVPCDRAAFVSETIPDGTNFNPGQAFTKTWTLKNTGSCTWNANYDVVFSSGASMGSPAAKQLTSGTVGPGQSIQISLDLKTPTSAGTHRGEFKLRNGNGVLFGIGDNEGPFWVEIDVEGTLYNFVTNYCAAGVTWTSNAGALPCPGTSGAAEGWVLKLNDPKLENGVTDDEPAILVHPAKVNDGWIKGIFPEITVTSDVFFKSVIGCNYGAAGCDVKFKLNYKIDGGAEQTLATWHEVQDGKNKNVKVDLSSLAGKDVQFILVVEANGDFNLDEAIWLLPRIEP
jgi:hypothetical protein